MYRSPLYDLKTCNYMYNTLIHIDIINLFLKFLQAQLYIYL